MEVDPAAESGPTLTFLLTSATLTTLLMVLAIMVSEYLVSDVNQRMLQVLRQQAQHKLLTMGVAGVWRFHSGELVSRMFNDVGVLSGFVRRVLTDLHRGNAPGRRSDRHDVLSQLAPDADHVFGGAGRRLDLESTEWDDQEVGGNSPRRSGACSVRDFAEQLHGMSTIKGYQAEDFEHRRFVEQSTAYRRQFMRCELWATTLISLIWLVTTIGFIGIVWYGSKQVLQGTINVGALLAFCLYAAQTIEPIRKLSDVYAALQRFVAAAGRIYEVIDSKVAEPDGSIVLRRPIEGGIEFDKVKFAYRTGEPVLNGIHLTLKAGERAALVAPSGGGKSTLARLLVRSYDVQQGRILLDGIDLRDLRLMDLRRMVCVVEQEPFMFGGPLIDNIRYGSWDAPLEKIEKAVGIAGLEPLVGSLPQGLHSSLHEGGRNLSGGQKQRIALARAIVRDPRILILDEATSALDSDGERQILERMEDWLAQRTVLVMAHRLATVARMPRVIVLVEGRIAGDGTPSELLEECLPFRRMFGEQLEPLACSLHGSAGER